MIKNVLDGNMESTAYEDTLREMFGIHAYIAFTLDKVVTYAVRQVSEINIGYFYTATPVFFGREGGGASEIIKRADIRNCVFFFPGHSCSTWSRTPYVSNVWNCSKGSNVSRKRTAGPVDCAPRRT